MRAAAANYRVVFICAVLVGCYASAFCQEWHVETAGSVRIHFTSGNAAAFEALRPVVAEALEHIDEELRIGQLDSTDLYLAANRQVFHTLTGGRIPEWGSGCAFPARGQIYVHLEQSDLRQTVVHELAHIALYQVAQQAPLPRWFNEGLSMWLAREWEFRQSLDLSLSVMFDRTHSLAEVEELLAYPEVEARRAYSESLSAVLFLQELGGRLIWAEVLRETAATGSFELALVETVGMTRGEFSDVWRQHVRDEFNPLSLLAEFSVIWMSIVGLAIVAYIFTKYRGRQLARSWEEEGEDE